jgi:hypothetical protein
MLPATLIFSALLMAKDNSVSKPEAEEGWILLFDGESLMGWTAQTGTPWRVDRGSLEPTADAGYLRSNSAFADFSLKLEYQAPSGKDDCSVILRAGPDGEPSQTGYQLQIGDRPEWPTGSLVDLFKARSLRPEANQWHAIDATLSGDRLAVKLDGYTVVDGQNARSAAGFIVLACSTGARIQFRNIELKPLEMKPLFNGSDLSGWKVVGPPPPKQVGVFRKMLGGGDKPKEASWTVLNRTVHVEKGTGQLETAAMYDDFVLQLAIKVNSKDRTEHPRSAVFFRGDAGKLFTGYEVPVMNDRRLDDRGRLPAGSTGGLTNLQPARRAVANDNEFFTETIAARGRHIQVWVDGVPVSDVQDTRAEGTAPQKDARTTAGTISLQALDEKSNLDFRSLQVLQLPKILGKAPAQLTALTAAPVTQGAAAPPTGGQPAGPSGPPIDPSKPEVQQLMARAVATSDPEQLLQIYTRIQLLQPDNQVAANGRQQAQQKIDEAKAKKEKEDEAKAKEAKTLIENQQNGERATTEATSALLAGDLARAQTQLALAERLLPGDPRLTLLRQKLDLAIGARDRLWYALTGAGVLALVGSVVLFINSRGQKVAYLEVVEGLDKGKRFNLDRKVVHIGAIAKDGGDTNEIVVKDAERMISRFHCEIHKQGKKFYLIDCDSANGTMVDRKRIASGKALRIKPGTRVDLAGTCVLRLGTERARRN